MKKLKTTQRNQIKDARFQVCFGLVVERSLIDQRKMGKIRKGKAKGKKEKKGKKGKKGKCLKI